jgi:anhydro-N-acetylmuramic acid kinase
MRVAGVMSGTSLDGIDVAIVEIRGRRVETIGFTATPYPGKVRAAILGVSNCSTHTASISRLNFQLAELYARAVQAAVKRYGPVGLIGCHGQTVFHEGRSNTLQLGEPAVLAERTGVPVVSNFRARDIAAGGQGAPLVPYVDYLLFRHPRRARVALNVGGIANITVIPPRARPEDVIAFDTGPGNMVIDALVKEISGGKKNYDHGGRIAACGNIDRKLLADLLRDPYYRKRPPKSAGREQYGVEFIKRLKASGNSLEDLIATATVLTAATIARSVTQAHLSVPDGLRVRAGHGPVPQTDLIASGGGVHNPQIMAHLSSLLPEMTVATSTDFGVDADAKEAIAFAVLAYETWRGRPSNLPSATGARRPVLLGNVTPTRISSQS